MHKKSFLKSLDDLNSRLFSDGIFKPIDLIIFQLICCKLEGKEGIISGKEIIEKIGITHAEFDESMERLSQKGILRDDPTKLIT